MLPLALTIAAFWVIVAFMENIVTECMNLVFLVPGQIFTWVGGHFGSDVGMSGAGSTARGAEQGIGQAGEVGKAAGEGGLTALGKQHQVTGPVVAKGGGWIKDRWNRLRNKGGAGGGSISNGGAPGKAPGGKSNAE